MQAKKLYVPYSKDELPKIVTTDEEYHNFEGQSEGFCISPELTLLAKIQDNAHPNPHLVKFGVEFFGACLIIKENEDGEVDIDEDIYEKLGEIFQKDKEQREKYLQNLVNDGVKVIRI